MKRRLWVGLTAATAIAVSALSGVARAGGTDDFGCSNATLNGEYAFGVTSYTSASLPNSPPYVVTVVNGIKMFDGHGNLTQRDYQGDNLAGPDFAPPGQEKGTYTVNSDCTGSMVINLNAPVTSGSTGVISIMFVMSNGGRYPRSRFGVHSTGCLRARDKSNQRRRLEGRVSARTVNGALIPRIEMAYPSEEVGAFG